MARKAIVDKDIILSMLREGETTQRIAGRFNVSRQAIDLHRRDFIEKGLLPDKRAARTRRIQKETASLEQTPPLPQSTSSEVTISLDEQIDLIISAFNALKLLPLLEKEIETYKLENEKALGEIERLKEQEKKRLDQEDRWLLTQLDNDTNPSQ